MLLPAETRVTLLDLLHSSTAVVVVLVAVVAAVVGFVGAVGVVVAAVFPVLHRLFHRSRTVVLQTVGKG